MSSVAGSDGGECKDDGKGRVGSAKVKRCDGSKAIGKEACNGCRDETRSDGAWTKLDVRDDAACAFAGSFSILRDDISIKGFLVRGAAL